MTHVKHVIHMKETPYEIKQILKSLHEDRKHMGLIHHVFLILSQSIFPTLSPKSV